MVFIEGSGVGMDRNSYEKLWEIVIQPEINTFIDDFSCDASVFQELRLRLRVAPDAKELIWSRYCYYNRKCKYHWNNRIFFFFQPAPFVQARKRMF